MSVNRKLPRNPLRDIHSTVVHKPKNRPAMDEVEDNVFILGKESSDFVKIKIYCFPYPSSTDFCDGNWINSTISLRVGSFKASYDEELRNVNFYQCMNELERL